MAARKLTQLTLTAAPGAHIVPVYCFGNSDAFALAKLPRWLAYVSRKLRISLTFFHGRYGISMPHQVRLTFAHGEVVRVNQIEEPTSEMIDEVHARVVASLQTGFNSAKEGAGYRTQRLEIR